MQHTAVRNSQIDDVEGRFMRKILILGLLFASAAWPNAAQNTEQALDYDQRGSLDVQEKGRTKRGDVLVLDISFASPKGGRVPSYLVVPNGKGPFAAVIWGHWYWANSQARNRSEFLDEAVALAPTGVVSLLTDGPVARPGHVEDKDPLSERQVAELIEQIIDMRRGVDLLVTRKDVDPQRIAYVGHSYNATVGAFLRGIDKRFKAFVLMAGGLSHDVDMKSKEYQEFRQKIGPEKFDAFEAKYRWLNPGEFVSRASPAIVFLQYGTKDLPFLTSERAREYAAVVSEPKRFQLYEAPHALNAEARRDRLTFLAEQLKLKPLSTSAMAAIPDLYQPPDQGQ
jgi:dienelactone hydrolase